MKSLKWFLLTSALVMTTHFGCGHRYREASSGRSASEVSEFFRGLQSSNSGATQGLQKAQKLLEEHPETVLYYSEAPGDMGPLHAVVPLDFSFVNKQINASNLESVRVYFLDLLTDTGHLNYLIIEYKLVGEPTSGYVVYSNDDLTRGDIVEGEFNSALKDENGNALILVRSFDTDDTGEDLNEIVQFEVSGLNASGQEVSNLGQISSMEAFNY